MEIDELAHTIKHAASQQVQGFGSTVRGYAASYDPNRHALKAIIPTLRDENDIPLLTNWMPIASPNVGAGYGMQWVPKGGATLTNPTLGEPVLIHMVDSQRGTYVCAGFFYHDSMLPPSSNADLTSPLGGGDIILMGPSGSYTVFRASGDIEHNSQTTVTINTKTDVNVNATGNANVNAKGNVNILSPIINLGSSAAGTFYKLCTSIFETWASTHTHTYSGGTTSGPVQAIPANSLTSITNAQ